VFGDGNGVWRREHIDEEREGERGKGKGGKGGQMEQGRDLGESLEMRVVGFGHRKMGIGDGRMRSGDMGVGMDRVGGRKENTLIYIYIYIYIYVYVFAYLIKINDSRG
jgi:hypothetical protein